MYKARVSPRYVFSSRGVNGVFPVVLIDMPFFFLNAMMTVWFSTIFGYLCSEGVKEKTNAKLKANGGYDNDKKKLALVYSW